MWTIMKSKMTGVMLGVIGMLSFQAAAQFDDLYYKPGSATTVRTTSNTSSGSGFGNNSSGYDSQYFDYDAYEDQDFQYSSRIRRFQRPNPGFGFYDPFFVDVFYYDPFFMGAGDIYAYNAFYNPWNRWNRFNRWNRWGGGWGMNPWMSPYFGSPSMVIINNYGWGGGWNAGFGGGFGFYDPWCPGFGWNGFGYGGFNNGWGGGFNNGWGGGWNNGWGGGWNNNIVDNGSGGRVYGPRRSGAVSTTERSSVRNVAPARDPRTGAVVDGVTSRERQAEGVNERGNSRFLDRTGTEAEASAGTRTNPVRESATNNTETPQRKFFNVERANSSRETNTSPANSRTSETRQPVNTRPNTATRGNDQPSSRQPIRSNTNERTQPSRQESTRPIQSESSPRSNSRGGGFDSGSSPSRSSSPSFNSGGGSSGSGSSRGGGSSSGSSRSGRGG